MGTLGDRLLTIWPLLFGFLIVSGVYVWQGSKHPTPWLFSDEVEYAQVSRAIAETGIPARRGVEHWGLGLFPWLIAPFWWIDNLQTAYSGVKTFNALVMTAAMFPTYGLARMLMSRPYALLAAIGSVTASFFVYSAMVMQEPVAYLAAAVGFYVAARVLVKPTWRNIGLAVVVAFVAQSIRDELIVIPAIMIGSFAVRYVCFGRGADYLRRASARRRVAITATALVALALLLVAARQGAGEVRVAYSTPSTMLDQALWAWGAMIIGLGVLPVVIGLAMVWAPPLARTRELVAFTSVLATAVVLLTAYVAVKGAYQSVIFDTRVEERNLLYVTPLLFVGLALYTATRAIRVPMLTVSTALVAWAIHSVPLPLAGLEGDAPGLAILSRLHDDYELGFGGAQRLLFLLLALSVLVGLAPRLIGNRRVAAWIVVGAALLSIGWSARAEFAASTYSNTFSQQFYSSLPRPLGWVDEITKGQGAVYIGQKIADPNGVWSMEFWNRDVREVWSLDGTAPGPGPTITPDLAATDGRLRSDPGYPYAVIDKGLAIDGETVVEQGALQLVRIASPLRLRNSIAGVFSDGWIGTTKPAPSVSADYNRYDAPAKPGMVFVTLSRKGFCGPSVPGRVVIDVGRIALGQQRDGILGKRTAETGWIVDSCSERTFPIPTPGGPFHVRVTVTPPFQPVALDPRNFERRYFGAQLGIVSQP